MKAKQYANQFIDAPVHERREVLSQILASFWKETQELIKLRNAGTLSAMVGIVRQQDEKYRTFAGIINNSQPLIKNTGYRLLVRQVDESIYLAAFDEVLKV